MKLKITYFFVILLIVYLLFNSIYASPDKIKSTLVLFSDLVWVRVSLVIPDELVASRSYSFKIRILVVESEGDFKLFIKGIRVMVGSEVLEFVPDTPLEFNSVGDGEEVSIDVSPRIFASNLAPGDVRDVDVKIEFSYYLEGEKKIGGEIVEVYDSGLYKVFSSIPVRVIVPKTYVYVQPKLEITYEPSYIVNVSVRVWVVGEGFIENARVRVSGLPVQCYLLSTGKISAGENKTVYTIANITELGLLAKDTYSLGITVEAETPWGYVYTYKYSTTLKLLKVRRLSASIPNTVYANAYTPVQITLTPSPESKEKVKISVYYNGHYVDGSTYPVSALVLADSSGEGEVKITASSILQAPISITRKITVVDPKPSVSASFSANSLYIMVKPLLKGGVVEVRLYKENKLLKTYMISSFSKSEVNINGIPAYQGIATLWLGDLEGGKYSAVITYRGGGKMSSTTINFEIPVKNPLVKILSFIPLPYPLNLLILLIPLLVILIIITALILRKRRKGEEEAEEKESEEELS